MATYLTNHLRFLSILIFSLCALCTMHGAVPSTPLAYYTPSASQNMTQSGNGDPNDEPYTVIQQDTAIEHAASTLDANALRYDILGRPVNDDYKGIVISPVGKYRMK